MSDASQIHSLTADDSLSSVEKDMLTYSESELRFLPDTNMGNYDSNIITFSTEQLRTVWWSFASAYLAIPIKITAPSGGEDFSAGDAVCFKQSVLDFISRVQVSTSSGQLLVSEDNIQMINYIRLLVEKDVDWMIEEGNSLLMSKDFPTASFHPGIQNPELSTNRNLGYAERIRLFKSSCKTGETTTFSTVLTIPLKYLSDFFSKMDFPLINGSFDLQFGFNSNAFKPFSAEHPYTVEVGKVSANFPGSDVALSSGCRLYYHAVKFTPSLNQKMVSALNKGMTKRVFFRVADTYLPKTRGVDKDVDSGTLSKLVSASTVHPLRVWLLAHPVDSLTGDGLHFYPGGFKNANILINNDPLLKQSLNTPQDFYNVLSQQMPGQGDDTGKGGLISYPEFLSTYRLHCLDCQRLGGRLADPNAAVSIQVEATRDSTYSATNCDNTVIVERLQAVSFHLDSSSIKVLVGLNQ